MTIFSSVMARFVHEVR